MLPSPDNAIPPADSLPTLTLGRRRWLGPVALAGFFLLLVTAGFLLAKPTHEATDEQRFHWPQVRHFMQQPFNGTPYPSWVQMTPGHHIVLSWIGRLLDSESAATAPVSLRLANAVFGLALLLACWCLFRDGRDDAIAGAALLCLPLAVSPYILGATLWIMSDNGALLWTVLTLALLCQPRLSPAGVAATACCITLAVLWRQNYIFLLLPLLVRALLAPAAGRERYWLLVAAAPPLAALAWFVSLWGGLVPPAYQHEASRINLAVLPYVLAVFGCYGLFYLGFLVPELRLLASARGMILVAIAVPVGLMASTFLAPRPDEQADGILLKAIAATGNVTGLPPAAMLTALVVAGALFLLPCCLRLLRSTTRKTSFAGPVGLAFMAGWIIALSVSAKVFQRYFDSLVLVNLGLVAATAMAPRQPARVRGPVSGDSAPGPGRLATAGPACLAALLLLVSLVKLAG